MKDHRYSDTSLHVPFDVLLSTNIISDDSTGTLGVTDERLAGRVLLIVTESIPLLVWIVLVVGSVICLGKYLPVTY